MKDFKQHILEKLKVTKDIDLHLCKVELDKFIPWIYGLSYYCVDDLVPDDLTDYDAPFKDTLKKDFNNDPDKLYTFFVRQVNKNPIINVESTEDHPGAWEFEFTLDGITFKTDKKYRWPLDEWKKRNPSDNALNFYVNESKIDEKLKVSKDNIRTEDANELFATVVDALQFYPEGQLDVKPLQIMCQYVHNSMHRLRLIDHIYYSNAPKSKKEWMMLTLDNDVSIRIDDFNMFHALVFSKNGESSEEILNNILHLMSK